MCKVSCDSVSVSASFFSVMRFFRLKLYSDHFRFICLRLTQNIRTNTSMNRFSFWAFSLPQICFLWPFLLHTRTFESIYLFHLCVLFVILHWDIKQFTKNRLFFWEHFNRFGYFGWEIEIKRLIKNNEWQKFLFLNLLFGFSTGEKKSF